MPKLSEIYEDLYNLGAVLIAEYAPLPTGADACVVEADGLYGVFFRPESVGHHFKRTCSRLP